MRDGGSGGGGGMRDAAPLTPPHPASPIPHPSCSSKQKLSKNLKLPPYQTRKPSGEESMIEHDFDEDFVPIAAELQRLPYLSPSRDFADRVIAGVDRLQSARVVPARASRHLELHQGGQQSGCGRRWHSCSRA